MVTKSRRQGVGMADDQEWLLSEAAGLSGISVGVVAAQTDWVTFNDLIDAPVTELSPGLQRLGGPPLRLRMSLAPPRGLVLDDDLSAFDSPNGLDDIVTIAAPLDVRPRPV